MTVVARNQFDDFKNRGQTIADADLDRFWETLRPATIEDMLGDWKGGDVVTTMVYDGVPIHDHFKMVDDSTAMGIMNGKAALDKGRHLYFYLERV